MPRLLLLVGCLLLLVGPTAEGGVVHHVIHVSVDGLRPDAVTNLGPDNAPNFYRMRTEGAFTDNARSDYDFTVTLPNHTTQLTGRGVVGPAGHNWTGNDDPEPGQTLHSNKGSYVAGVFDVMHHHSLRTGLYAGKTKFSLLDVSWDAENGAPDATGRDKIDVFVYDADSELLTLQLVADMTAAPFDYVFLHLADGDAVGHLSGWDPTPGSDYSNAIMAMDRRLGLLFDMIDHDARFAWHTAIILTADHGGIGVSHDDASLPEDYTVPFYVWGPGVGRGVDLYAANTAHRLDPGTSRPSYDDPGQPIRNGEAANLSLRFLGLAPVPGSTINAAQDLAVAIRRPFPSREAVQPAGQRPPVRRLLGCTR